ncbi:MAG: hypothetical protein KA144_15635, partial [Xanthomonadaceae bacterium]|nr:hypothetical protein [Xanthomonadaceae bacterium]
TEEFYRMLDRHLKDDGLLVQWIHIYELDDRVFSPMPAALSKVFPHIQVYVVNSGDLLLVASRSPIREPDFSRFPQPIIERELKRLDAYSAESVRMRIVADKPFLDAYLWGQDAKPHSDFYPFVMLNAPRTRFKKENAFGLISYVGAGVPLLDGLVLKRPFAFDGELIPTSGNPRSDGIAVARRLLAILQHDDARAIDELLGKHDLSGAFFLKRFAGKAVGPRERQKWQRSLIQIAGVLANNTNREQVVALLESGAIKPDLEASDPTVAVVYEIYRTIGSGDHARILAIPTAPFATEDSGYDPVVGDYVLASQMLSAIQTENAAAFQNALNDSARRAGDPSMRQTRLLLHLYGLQHFKGIKLDGAQ